MPDHTSLEAPAPFTKPSPQHLNSTGCEIRYVEGKGRAVFASRRIPAQTVVEISPVLLFSAAEYEQHGKYTVLDHFTFKWRDGRMALALGLGSLFNHSNTPNVSYIIESATDSIRYITSRAIEPGEELCIFYGHKLWFDDIDAAAAGSPVAENEPDDGWGGLTSMDSAVDGDLYEESVDGDSDEIVPEDLLPFVRIRNTPDEVEEETPEAIFTVDAWAVDIPDPRHTTTMLKWLKTSGFDTPALAHLKRIRKTPTGSTLLIAPSSPTDPIPSPSVDVDIALSAPYIIPVPRFAALTKTSLELKNALWPTVFAPRRKYEPEPWSHGKLRWARGAVNTVMRKAQRVRDSGSGELPIMSYVPAPLDDPSQPSFLAHDTRTSTHHPLRHSVLNVIRKVADHRAPPASPPHDAAPIPTSAPTSTSTSTSTPVPSSPAQEPPSNARNGQNYLLTGRTLFTTHEPCIMCAMALLHSRVKEIVYVHAMGLTGGCGGAACVPRLEGVNHRYSVLHWIGGAAAQVDGRSVGEKVDA